MLDTFSSDQSMLRSSLENVLTMHNIRPTDDQLGADIYRLLQAPGKLLSIHPSSSRLPIGVWALLPLTLARYCTPLVEFALASRVALVCELLHCALDAFDEIEDDDFSEERDALGNGRFLNAATFLYSLLPLLLDEITPSSLSSERLRALHRLLSTEVGSAMRGQHRDIVAESEDLVSFLPEECLRIASAKSGTLFRLVCRMSTGASDASHELAQLFADIGEIMGLVAQLENDIHGLEKELSVVADRGEVAQKSDLRRGKKTLPIVLAQKQMVALQHALLPADRESVREQEEARVQATAYEQAIKASLGAAAHLREQALGIALQIENLRGEMPRELRILLNLEASY